MGPVDPGVPEALAGPVVLGARPDPAARRSQAGQSRLAGRAIRACRTGPTDRLGRAGLQVLAAQARWPRPDPARRIADHYWSARFQPSSHARSTDVPNRRTTERADTRGSPPHRRAALPRRTLA